MPIGIDEKYFGYDGFIWFIGVVEDINDPEQVSRVKVRILGHHPTDNKLLKTKNLMWAQVMMPTTSASTSGIGFSPSGLVNGSYVFGFWMDGEYAQRPVIIGSWHGIPQELADPNKGFNDPDGVYPKEIDEPDTNKLSRGENTIPDISDGEIQNPPSAYAAVYPNNKVFQSTSGHIVEFDDTEGAERIRVYHRSGTFVEMHPNGDTVQSNKNKWQITTGNDSAHVTGDVKIVVDGNANIDVGGDVTQTVGGNVEQTVSGTLDMDISKAVTITAKQGTTWTGNIALKGDLDITGTGTATTDFVSAGISGKGHVHPQTGGTTADGDKDKDTGKPK